MTRNTLNTHRRLYVECGTTAQSQFNTGIQRVVRNIVRECLFTAQQYGFEPEPVGFTEGRFIRVNLEQKQKPPIPTTKIASSSTGEKRRALIHFLRAGDQLLSSILGLRLYLPIRNFLKMVLRKAPPVDKIVGSAMTSVELEGASSVLLLLDSTWDDSIWSEIDTFRSKGGVVCAVLYDLIPFSHPETVERQTRLAHTHWWTKAPIHLDAIMCISQAVKDDFLVWQNLQMLSTPLPENRVGYFHLGAELPGHDPVIRLLTDRKPYFLVVGSLEPRKNHKVILDAFELLWRQGISVRLVIVGANGWKNEILLERILGHSELDKKLFLIRDATDRDLTALYGKTSGLVIASVAEGFGLPIVEAYQHGAAVICSDIPVFREVAGDHARYFDPRDPQLLSQQVVNQMAVSEKCSAHFPVVSPTWISWRESTKQLLQQIRQLK